MTLMSVDFPAPFWPRRQWTPPARTSRSTLTEQRGAGELLDDAAHPRIGRPARWRPVGRSVGRRRPCGEPRGHLLDDGQGKLPRAWQSWRAERDRRKTGGSLCAWTSPTRTAPRPTGIGDMFQPAARRPAPAPAPTLATLLTDRVCSTIAARRRAPRVGARLPCRRGHLDRWAARPPRSRSTPPRASSSRSTSAPRTPGLPSLISPGPSFAEHVVGPRSPTAPALCSTASPVLGRRLLGTAGRDPGRPRQRRRRNTWAGTCSSTHRPPHQPADRRPAGTTPTCPAT